MNKEIERKFAIKYVPEKLEIKRIVNIDQAFIYRDFNTLSRIRKIENVHNKEKNRNIEYIYTVKTKGDIQYDNSYNIGKKYEIENNITKEEYEKLLKNKISNVIRKTRIVTPINEKLNAEIDIYYEYLEGLVTLEVEFSNENEAVEFLKPDWIGEELGDKELSNRKLAEMTKEDFIKKVAKEFMDNNKIVIKDLLGLSKMKNIK